VTGPNRGTPPDPPVAITVGACARRSVYFTRGDSAEFPFRAEVDGQRWVVRINDFPERALYSLLIDDREAGDLDDWPQAWRKPD